MRSTTLREKARPWRAHVLALASVFLGAGCSEEDLAGFFGNDAGAQLDGASAGSPDEGTSACNRVSLDGPFVTPTPLTRALSFAGGSPVDGTFVLMKAEVATGIAPAGDRRTIVVSGRTLEFASANTSGESRWNATFETNMVDMTVTRTCGGVGVKQMYKYTAGADSLLLKSGEVIYTYGRR